MPAAEFELKQNLPHILAIGVLIFALLIVATQAGLMRCSDLGDSYCDIYYTVMGNPSVLILTGDSGLGDPAAMSRYIQDSRGVPVKTATISQLSAGMLKRYNVVIVERAREIPTEKLKIIKDYVFEDFGRLVWVGDAGTEGSSGDKLCKTMDYDVQWDAEDGRHKDSYDYPVCIEEDELSYPEEASVSQTMQVKQEALFNAAMERIGEVCEDVFQGTLEPLRWEDGFFCANQGYDNTYIMWENENSFRRVVNPWTRGDYDKPGLDKSVPGIDFGKDVLGISFIADDYAVVEFEEYQEDIAALKEQLAYAHAGFVECNKNMPDTCNPAKKLVRIQKDLESIGSTQGDIETELTAIISTLTSLETQKQNSNSSYIHVTDANVRMQGHLDNVKDVDIPDSVPSGSEVTGMRGMKAVIETAITDLNVMQGSETDDIVKNQVDAMVGKLTTLAATVEVKVSGLEDDVSEYESCEGEAQGTLPDLVAVDTGFKPQLKTLMTYSSPLIDDSAAVEFINIIQGDSTYASLANKLEDYDAVPLCGDSGDVAKGFLAAAEALRIAEDARIDPGAESNALAMLMVADDEHELVRGVSKSVDLKDNGLPVPFVLVATSEQKTYTVTQLKTTPAYKGQSVWPAITVKDPKFAVHTFGRGTVVYYAFPPEIDEIFMKNLVDYILY